MAKNPLQQLLEAGVQFGEMSRQQAEDAVKRLVKAGAVRRSEAEGLIQTLLERGRETAMHVAEVVQNEVTKQLGWLTNRVDDVEDQVEALARRLAPGDDGGDPGATPVDEVAKKAAAKKAPPKKAPARKKAPGAKKAPAEKAPAKKQQATTRKRAAARTSSVRRPATTRPG